MIKILNKFLNKLQGYPDFINRKNGFLFYDDGTFILQSDKIDKCVKYINQKQIRKITLNSCYGGKIDDLSFLYKLKDIEGLSILDKLEDIEPINSLKKLKILSISNVTSKIKIDLNNFPNLDFICGDFRNFININKAINLETCSLYNYKNMDLKCFSEMQNLKTLNFIDSKIENLNGINHLNHLEKLSFDNTTLKSLDGLNKNLKKLHIDGAKKLNNFDSLYYQKDLEFVSFRKICNLDNIDFIKNMDNLKFLIIGTKVKNLDNDIIERLKKIDHSAVGFKIYNTNK